MKNLPCLLGVLVVVLAGCAQETGTRSSSQGLAPALSAPFRKSDVRTHFRAGGARPGLGSGKISHVVIIIQENRTPDDLFSGLPGAHTEKSGLNSAGERVKLQPEPLTAPYDVDHSHPAFETAYDSGKMDGFNIERSTCLSKTHACVDEYLRAYAYVPRQEVQPYFTMATEYAFGDKMFASNSGPSFPAHQYLVSGTSTIEQGSSLRASENPVSPTLKFEGGCDSPTGSLVMLIDANGTEDQQMYPCFDRPALTDLLDAQSLSWRYYQAHPGSGLWNALDAIKHIRDSPEYSTHVVTPPSQVLTDIANGALASVVWITPTPKASDHAGVTNGSGPSWVASVVNAIGESQYWNNTAIFVTWDDWGGWFDHVKPPQYNSYELGFRVPLIVISPYAKQSYVSHHQHEFGSILKFVEQTFGLGSLGTTDVRADNLADCFDFSQNPRAFTPIPSSYGRKYFLSQPPSLENPDDDF